MKLRIGEVCEEFIRETGVFVNEDKIRRYESLGLFSSTRDKSTDYREFSEAEQSRVREVLMMLELGIAPQDILNNNEEKIKDRIKSMAYLLEQLKKSRKEVV